MITYALIKVLDTIITLETNYNKIIIISKILG